MRYILFVLICFSLPVFAQESNQKSQAQKVQELEVTPPCQTSGPLKWLMKPNMPDFN